MMAADLDDVPGVHQHTQFVQDTQNFCGDQWGLSNHWVTRSSRLAKIAEGVETAAAR